MGRSRDRRRSRSRRRTPSRRRSRGRREERGREDRRRDEKRRDDRRDEKREKKRSRSKRRDRTSSPIPVKARSKSKTPPPREVPAVVTNKKDDKFRFDSPPKQEEIEKDKKPAQLNPFAQVPGLQSAIGVLNPSTQLALPGGMSGQLPSSLQAMLPPPPDSVPAMNLAKGLAAIQTPAPVKKMEDFTNGEKKCMISISNLPPNIAAQHLRSFINQVSIAMKIGGDVAGDPVKNVYVPGGSPIGMVEYRSPEEAERALKLDGVELMGQKIKVEKPRFEENEGNPGIPGATGIPGAPQGVGPETGPTNVVPTLADMMRAQKLQEIKVDLRPGIQKMDTDTKLALANIPRFVQEKAIGELLNTFGKLKFYRVLTREEISDDNENIVFFEYFDTSVQNQAKVALQGLDLGKQKLVVMTPDEVMTSGKLVKKQQLGNRVIPTRILYLKNIAKHEDLFEQEDYDEIVNDIKMECECFGEVVSINVPQPDLETKRRFAARKSAREQENDEFRERQKRLMKGETLLALGDKSAPPKPPPPPPKVETKQEVKEPVKEEPSPAKSPAKRSRSRSAKSKRSKKSNEDKVIEDASSPKDKKIKEEKIEEVEMEDNPDKKRNTVDSALKSDNEDEKEDKEESADDKYDPPGVGYAFIEFIDIEGASVAKKTLNGRKFGELEVQADYMNEEKFFDNDFTNIKPNTISPKEKEKKEKIIKTEDGEESTKGDGLDDDDDEEIPFIS